MENIKYLRTVIPRDVFEAVDFHLVKRHASKAAQYNLLSRLLKSGDIKKVSRGLYIFGDIWRRKPISKFTIANKLVEPSYISFESALSFHGLIPEAVYTTMSACFQKDKKSFKTDFGVFIYQHVPTSVFLLEVERIQTDSGPLLMATPMKALFDLVCVRRKNYLALSDLEKDLRIEPSDLLKHAKDFGVLNLEELARSYKKKTCISLLNILKKALR